MFKTITASNFRKIMFKYKYWYSICKLFKLHSHWIKKYWIFFRSFVNLLYQYESPRLKWTSITPVEICVVLTFIMFSIKRALYTRLYLTCCLLIQYCRNWISENLNPFVPNAPFLYPLKIGGRERVHLERMGWSAIRITYFEEDSKSLQAPMFSVILIYVLKTIINISSVLVNLLLKVLCYLKGKKIWVVVVEN